MIEIKRIPVEDFLAARELHAEYAEECSIREIGHATPNEALYRKLDEGGGLRCFGAFSDGELIGFANILVYGLLHYIAVIGTVESLFVAKSHRTTSAWIDMKAAIKDHARDAGCIVVLCSCPVGGALERVLEASKDSVRTNSIFMWRIS